METKAPDLMDALTGDMRYQTQRQKVLAQNVANIDTPNYQARDLKKVDFGKVLDGEMTGKLPMATTSPQHLSGLGGGGAGVFSTANNRNPFETKPVKNDVSLDEEMAKISDTGTQYDLASSLFKKFTGLYRAALGK